MGTLCLDLTTPHVFFFCFDFVTFCWFLVGEKSLKNIIMFMGFSFIVLNEQLLKQWYPGASLPLSSNEQTVCSLNWELGWCIVGIWVPQKRLNGITCQAFLGGKFRGNNLTYFDGTIHDPHNIYGEWAGYVGIPSRKRVSKAAIRLLLAANSNLYHLFKVINFLGEKSAIQSKIIETYNSLLSKMKSDLPNPMFMIELADPYTKANDLTTCSSNPQKLAGFTKFFLLFLHIKIFLPQNFFFPPKFYFAPNIFFDPKNSFSPALTGCGRCRYAPGTNGCWLAVPPTYYPTAWPHPTHNFTSAQVSETQKYLFVFLTVMVFQKYAAKLNYSAFKLAQDSSLAKQYTSLTSNHLGTTAWICPKKKTQTMHPNQDNEGRAMYINQIAEIPKECLLFNGKQHYVIAFCRNILFRINEKILPRLWLYWFLFIPLTEFSFVMRSQTYGITMIEAKKGQERKEINYHLLVQVKKNELASSLLLQVWSLEIWKLRVMIDAKLPKRQCDTTIVKIQMSKSKILFKLHVLIGRNNWVHSQNWNQELWHVWWWRMIGGRRAGG
ncbi:hypothetical protein VP01_2710g2 [Puccinia sorghi]|uniref:Uncharacterized protein n=1 Tax=Puccinia sorghi TaxID=27349 RepID=A0A0L6V466_9BASI|nr:hypothetical protein VP01_2710g2 [Puccinia sorghi]